MKIVTTHKKLETRYEMLFIHPVSHDEDSDVARFAALHLITTTLANIVDFKSNARAERKHLRNKRIRQHGPWHRIQELSYDYCLYARREETGGSASCQVRDAI